VGSALTVTAFFISLAFGGFLLNIRNVSAYLRWPAYMSFMFYGFEALLDNQLNGFIITIDVAGANLPVGGQLFISVLGLNAENLAIDVVMLCVLLLEFLLLAYLLLWAKGTHLARRFRLVPITICSFLLLLGFKV
jgi:hypothetical protein